MSATAQLYVATAPRSRQLLNLTSNPTPIALRRGDGGALGLVIRQAVEPIRDEDFVGEFRFTTRAYVYAIHPQPTVSSTDALAYWHWNPSRDGRGPHVHASVEDPGGRGMRLHLPTGRRVSVEQIVEHLIEDWDVVPARVDWRAVLDDGRERFDTYRRQD